MKIDNPIAYPYFIGNEVYILASEKEALKNNVSEISEVSEAVISFNYQGNNKKNFLVITNYPDQDFIAPNHTTALENTLKRLGFEMDDLAILNSANYPKIVFNELLKFFNPTRILILGNSAMPEIETAIPFNKCFRYQNIHILLTFSFNEMMDNTDDKKLFWEQMKQL